MSSKELELALKIKADLDQSLQQMSRFEKQLLGIERNTKASARAADKQNRSLAKTRSEVSQINPLLARMGGLLAAAFSAREIAAATEAYTTIKNRLALVTDGSKELAEAQDEVFQIAQRSRQALEPTAELYQRIATNADELELSGTRVAGVVDTINKTLAISNATGPSATAALIQLSQAMASGTLRGEELNSVLEQAPALAKTLAEGLGVTVGEMRSLGEAGQLTAKNVITALESQAESVDEQFNKIQASGRQGLTVLGNSLIKVIGEFDQATGASREFAQEIIDVAAWLDSGELTEGLISSFDIWSLTLEAMSADINSLEQDLDGLGSAGESVADFLGQAFLQMPANIRAGIQIATIEILALFDKTVAYADYSFKAIKAVFTDTTQAQATAALEDEIKRIESVRLGTIDTILQEREAILETADAEKEARAEQQRLLQEAREKRRQEIAQLRSNASEHKTLLKTTNKEEQNRLKAAERFVLQLERQAATYGKTAAEVRAYTIAEKKLSGTLLERAKAANAALTALELLNSRRDIEIRLLTSLGNDVKAETLNLEKEFEPLIVAMKASGDQAGVELIEKLINVELARTRLGEVQAEIDKALGDQNLAEQSVQTELDAGLIDELEARERLLNIHQQTAAVLEQQKPLLEELAQQPGAVGEAAQAALQQLNNQLTQLRATSSLLESTLKSGLKEGIQTAIQGLADGTLTLREAIGSLVQSVANAVTEMLAQIIAQKAVLSLFGGSLGGGLLGFSSGGFTGPGSKYDVAGVVHAGEYVQPMEVMQEPGALQFMEAFRVQGMQLLNNFRGYDEGGSVGGGQMLRPVFSGAGGGPTELNIFNSLDSESTAQAIGTTSAFGKAIENHIRSDRRHYKAILEG
ncbi:tape measure protein [Neptuniibacter sp.]|uniref:tape measure protein n=1 Tax=Neptuniibacter sp. TaxID=1962643 RepID=UPI003B5C74FE